MASEGVSAREIPVALEVSTICKSFGQHKVLKGISLTAREHDVVAILGSSGSGKSTFLRCINLLEMPDSGEVRLKGELIRMGKRGGGSMRVPWGSGRTRRGWRRRTHTSRRISRRDSTGCPGFRHPGTRRIP
mgnify:CR=1 FL=1